MKKIISLIILSAILLLCLSSCHDRGPSYGNYQEGYWDGYSDGVFEAQEQISSYAEECFNNIDIADAIQVLTNYADGEPVSEAELHAAIWTVNSFYNDSWDIIHELDDYTIE